MRLAVQMGHTPRYLGYRGGFPVDYFAELHAHQEFCAPIRAALQELPPSIRISLSRALHRRAGGDLG